jgi:hypothetical protein
MFDETPVSMKHNEYYSQKAERIVIPDEDYAVELLNYKVRRLPCPKTKYIYGVLQHEIGSIAFNLVISIGSSFKQLSKSPYIYQIRTAEIKA